MFKKIVGGCLIVMASFVIAMENVTVMLGLVQNNSLDTYEAIYGAERKAIFFPNTEMHLNHLLFSITRDSKNFPMESRLTFEERLDPKEIKPKEYASVPLKTHQLSFIISSAFVFRVTLDQYIKSNNFEIKDNMHYFLNLFISQNNDISWKLMLPD